MKRGFSLMENKTLTMQIEEFKNSLVQIINESNIAPYFVEMVLRDIYLEVNQAAKNQLQQEQQAYIQSLQNAASANTAASTNTVSDETEVTRWENEDGNLTEIEEEKDAE